MRFHGEFYCFFFTPPRCVNTFLTSSLPYGSTPSSLHCRHLSVTATSALFVPLGYSWVKMTEFFGHFSCPLPSSRTIFHCCGMLASCSKMRSLTHLKPSCADVSRLGDTNGTAVRCQLMLSQLGHSQFRDSLQSVSILPCRPLASCSCA